MLAPMISYAQNYEDVILRRVFDGRPSGFYVDVGAADPVKNSVTHHFYERGWSGINVEPEPGFFARLVAARPRDVNLQLAVSSEGERAELLVVDIEAELSTLSPRLAGNYASTFETTSTTVAVRPLGQILAEHADRPIDFLKIDVEGAEADALQSFDLGSWAPTVLVVEATWPGTPEPSHEDWEPGVLEAGYALAQFDGLNRFYARASDERTLGLLRVPANYFDHFIQHRWWARLTPEARAELAAEGFPGN